MCGWSARRGGARSTSHVRGCTFSDPATPDAGRAPPETALAQKAGSGMESPAGPLTQGSVDADFREHRAHHAVRDGREVVGLQGEGRPDQRVRDLVDAGGQAFPDPGAGTPNRVVGHLTQAPLAEMRGTGPLISLSFARIRQRYAKEAPKRLPPPGPASRPRSPRDLFEAPQEEHPGVGKVLGARTAQRQDPLGDLGVVRRHARACGCGERDAISTCRWRHARRSWSPPKGEGRVDTVLPARVPPGRARIARGGYSRKCDIKSIAGGARGSPGAAGAQKVRPRGPPWGLARRPSRGPAPAHPRSGD